MQFGEGDAGLAGGIQARAGFLGFGERSEVQMEAGPGQKTSPVRWSPFFSTGLLKSYIPISGLGGFFKTRMKKWTPFTSCNVQVYNARIPDGIGVLFGLFC